MMAMIAKMATMITPAAPAEATTVMRGKESSSSTVGGAGGGAENSVDITGLLTKHSTECQSINLTTADSLSVIQ